MKTREGACQANGVSDMWLHSLNFPEKGRS